MLGQNVQRVTCNATEIGYAGLSARYWHYVVAYVSSEAWNDEIHMQRHLGDFMVRKDMFERVDCWSRMSSELLAWQPKTVAQGSEHDIGTMC